MCALLAFLSGFCVCEFLCNACNCNRILSFDGAAVAVHAHIYQQFYVQGTGVLRGRTLPDDDKKATKMLGISFKFASILSWVHVAHCSLNYRSLSCTHGVVERRRAMEVVATISPQRYHRNAIDFCSSSCYFHSVLLLLPLLFVSRTTVRPGSKQPSSHRAVVGNFFVLVAHRTEFRCG